MPFSLQSWINKRNVSWIERDLQIEKNMNRRFNIKPYTNTPASRWMMRCWFLIINCSLAYLTTLSLPMSPSILSKHSRELLNFSTFCWIFFSSSLFSEMMASSSWVNTRSIIHRKNILCNWTSFCLNFKGMQISLLHFTKCKLRWQQKEQNLPKIKEWRMKVMEKG